MERPVWLVKALRGGETRTSESVMEGHPDKIMDQIGDAILDGLIEQANRVGERPENVRCAIEAAAKGSIDGTYPGGLLVLLGEVTSATGTEPDFAGIARKVISEIGYTDPEFGFWHGLENVFVNITTQSPELRNNSYNEAKAGDQGIFFGYATNEHPSGMPLPIQVAHALTAEMTKARKDGQFPWLRPDGKSQVGIDYRKGKPVGVAHITLAAAHDPQHKLADVRRDLYKGIILPILDEFGLALPVDENKLIRGEGLVIVNGADDWDKTFGPLADAAVTGRKLDVDTYGGASPHGGGALSGKDPTKVDRSAKYAARFIARNLVHEGLADRVELELAYTIGQEQPDSVTIYTFGTEKRPVNKIYERAARILDLSVAGIIDQLRLFHTQYLPTARNGHFGHDQFPWEKLVD